MKNITFGYIDLIWVFLCSADPLIDVWANSDYHCEIKWMSQQ